MTLPDVGASQGQCLGSPQLPSLSTISLMSVNHRRGFAAMQGRVTASRDLRRAPRLAPLDPTVPSCKPKICIIKRFPRFPTSLWTFPFFLLLFRLRGLTVQTLHLFISAHPWLCLESGFSLPASLSLEHKNIKCGKMEG